ncbi:hypothetical protein U1Q18_005081 [Sarracenia purpurea var. burkii]
MAEDSEKRFHAVMDKLFHTPSKPKSKSTTTIATTESRSSSGVQLSRGEKFLNRASVLVPKSRGDRAERLRNLSGAVQTPLCRPWDRGDLMRRLTTFKSMTWFGKPQVVSAVNCARRGWVNVDVDTIACEACGARIFFSTPSSWSQHQVEKAALVFSLKLDNGHKLLCPWIDNSCDETLAQFPPTPDSVLVDDYKKRSSALSHLLALPVVSSSAIDYMTSPQLEHFLREFSVVGGSKEMADTPQSESLRNEKDTDSSVSYYQVQKVISLCGWEPRSLPYIVDSKDQQYQSTKDANLSDLSRGVSNGRNSSIMIYSSGMDGTVGTNDDLVAFGRVQDPNSVVLDCRLCGASVGLWTFSAVPRPLEFFRIVGCTEVYGEHNSAHEEDAIHRGMDDVENREGTFNSASTSAVSLGERRLNLNLTIAGGPSPTKQNFKAKISLPLIGRNLRARISSDPDFGDRQCVKNSFQGGKNHLENTLTEQCFQPEDTVLLHNKQVDDGHCDSMLCLNNDINEQCDTLENEANCDTSSEGPKSSFQGFPSTSTPDSNLENPTESSPNLVDGNGKKDKTPENAEIIAAYNLGEGVGSSSQVGEYSVTTTDAHVTRRNGEIVKNDISTIGEAHASYVQQNPVTDVVCGKLGYTRDGIGVEARVLPVNNDVMPWSIGKNKDQLVLDKEMGFDPIRQHRPFCPWIASINNSLPGWQQTLSALQRQKEFSCPSSTNTSSSSLIEDLTTRKTR